MAVKIVGCDPCMVSWYSFHFQYMNDFVQHINYSLCIAFKELVLRVKMLADI